MVEAETRLDDLQALERRVRLKQRDLGVRRVILLVADTRHNRAVLRHPESSTSFRLHTGVPAGLAQRRDPGGDAIVLL